MEFKRLFFVFIFIALGFGSQAQEDYFVYLQTENGKPFYVRIDNRVISSSVSGYLILPKLQEGQYVLAVGFPKNEFAEEKFTIDINDKSKGFLLKNFGEEGWSLFNLQTLALINPGSPAVETSVAKDSPGLKEDRFSQMLATVLNDSTLLRKDEPQIAVKSVNPVAKEPEENKAGNDNKNNLAGVSPPNTDSLKEAEIAKVAEENNLPENENSDVARAQITYHPKMEARTTISRVLSVTGRDGSEMIYVDKGENFTDTIRVFIPGTRVDSSDFSEVTATKESNIVKSEPAFTITPTLVPETENFQVANPPADKTPEVKKGATIKLSEEKSPPASQVFIIRADTAEEGKVDKEDSIILLPRASTSATNSDCKNLATENDYMKIRRKMAAERNKDDMILAARKIFRKKCFNTDQIRNLSYLFFEDEGRYMFFDAIYPYTSDTENFESLVSRLSDDYYINRFKAMVLKP